MLQKILSALLGAPAEQIAEYFKEKQKLKQEYKLAKLKGKIKVQEAKDAREAKALEADSSWESESIANSGWKDEYILIILSIPLVMSFVPGGDTYVSHGFQVLQATPEWYRWLILLIFTAVYGIRVWRRKL